MQRKGTHTFREILSQPDAWTSSLALLGTQVEPLRRCWRVNRPDEIIFTGCGSAYHLSFTAAAVFAKQSGVHTLALPASEVVLFPRTWLLSRNKPWLVASSRSGVTTETLRAMDVFRATYGSPIIGITCYQDTPFVHKCHHCLVASASGEQSVVETRSITSMCLIATALVAILDDEEGALERLAGLPGACRRLLGQCADLARHIGAESRPQTFFILGSGPRYGLARESALKLQEMSLSWAWAYHFLEFRHGPWALADGSSLVVGLVSDSARAQELAVLREAKGLGARVLAISEGGDVPGVDYNVALESGLPEESRTVLYLPPLQLMAYHRAMSRGLDPDRPTHLSRVVEVDLEET